MPVRGTSGPVRSGMAIRTGATRLKWTPRVVYFAKRRQEWSEIPDQLAIFKTMLSRRKAAGEDFAGASKSIGDPQARERIMEFASLAEAAAKGQPQEKAQAMVALGDAFEAAWKRSRKNADETFSQGGASLVLRENGHALGFTNLFEDLTLFYQVPGLPKEARDEYIQL